ncbi:MAG: hypothetical protein NW241_00960 [Bacteroidia bacterium]|nr:hypothetical protein [Bacteroidia bacterium]
MNRRNLLYAALALLMSLSACAPDPDADLDGIELEVRVTRMDSLMLAASEALRSRGAEAYFSVYQQMLQPERAFFMVFTGLDQDSLAARLSPASQDSLLAYAVLGPFLADSNAYALLDTVRQVFPYDYPFADRLTPMLKRLKKHFPDAELPAFATHIDDPSQVSQILSLPGYMSIGLQYFLGPKFRYAPPETPDFIRRRFDPACLEVAMANKIADELIEPMPGGKLPLLVEHVVHAGIRQYFIQQLLPHTPDSARLYYTSTQMIWADYYEARIYKELLDHFFEPDLALYREYLSEKPYTTSLSPESAPRIGAYCGWKIVSAYMKRHPEESLERLCARTDYETIFRESGYKP